MLHLAFGQMKNIEMGVVRRSKYYISKSIYNIFKEQIWCLELRSTLKLFPAMYFYVKNNKSTWYLGGILYYSNQSEVHPVKISVNV